VLVPVLDATWWAFGLRMNLLGGRALGSVSLMPAAWFVLSPTSATRLLVYLDPSAIRSNVLQCSFGEDPPLFRARSWEG